ncbi:signal transduction histidine kinase [Metapseudomonas resinovorans]|uniref:hypothetical protein n=1 Tax=Metapseudomonas resinovorans TaxID=53412 RepID=UPI003D1EAB2E
MTRPRPPARASSTRRRCRHDPDALMASLLFLREDELARRGIRLAWRNANPGVRPLGDRVALEQILHNLVQNAADALAGIPVSRTIVVTGGVEGRDCGHFGLGARLVVVRHVLLRRGHRTSVSWYPLAFC